MASHQGSSFAPPAWANPQGPPVQQQQQNPFEAFTVPPSSPPQQSSAFVPYQSPVSPLVKHENPFESYPPVPNVSPVSPYSSASESSQPQQPTVDSAGIKALSLLDHEFGTSAPDRRTRSDESIDQFKRGIDLYRERNSSVMALSLLDQAVTGNYNNPTQAPTKAPESQSYSQRMDRTRWRLQHERKKAHEKALMKEKFRRDKETFAKRVPFLDSPQVHRKPETSRRRKEPTADDVQDPESVNGMKCKLHHDMEKSAKDKALRLLEGLHNSH